MKNELIEYKHDGVTLEAFLSFEERTSQKLPVIFIFHSWEGRNEFACEKAKFLAKNGYVGCALDLYGKGVIGKSVEENGNLMGPFIEDRSFLQNRMFAGLDAIKNHPKVDRDQMGAIGFCFGGLCALDLARSGADIKGVVSFHGLLEAPKGIKNNPIRSKVLVLHGNDDPMVSSQEVLAFEKEMTLAKVDWQVHVYGHTMHAFTNPVANDPKMGTVYNSISEKRSMLAMENFFREIFHHE